MFSLNKRITNIVIILSALFIIVTALKTTGLYEGMENISEDTLNDAYVLGKTGMKPWGENEGFHDKNAKWIWSNSSGKTIAKDRYKPVTFLYKWHNYSKSNIEATINVIADNIAYLHLNDEFIGEQYAGWGGKGGLVNVLLKPGLNKFSITVLNANGEGAGLLATVIDDKKDILFSTGQGWKYYMPNEEYIYVGPSTSNLKPVTLPRKNMKISAIPLNSATKGSFDVSVTDNKLYVKRNDVEKGWEDQLVLKVIGENQQKLEEKKEKDNAFLNR